jgi:hypothetical protein
MIGLLSVVKMESRWGKAMPITKRLTIENVNLDDDIELDAFDDQVITTGLERVRAEGDELRRKGILDREGNLHLKEPPADMEEGADRDFGG